MADLLFGIAMAALLLSDSGKDFAVNYDSNKADEAKNMIQHKTYLSGFDVAIKAVDELSYAVDCFWKEYNATIDSLKNCIETCKTKIDNINVDIRACEASRKTYVEKSASDGTNQSNARAYLDYANGESEKIAEKQQVVAKTKNKIAVLQEDLNALDKNKEAVLKYSSDIVRLKSKLQSALSSAEIDAKDIYKKAENAIREIENYLSVRIEV